MTDITREEALKRIQHLFNTDRWDFVCSIDKDAIRLAYKSLENQRTGHWIKIPKHSLDGEHPSYNVFKCSECKTHWEYTFNFCPNCGAKMKGE